MGVELRRRDPGRDIGSCADCLFGVIDVKTGGTEPAPVVECRRFPPQVIVLLAAIDEDDDGARMLWPQVPGDGWCGEWVDGSTVAP